MGKSAEEKAAIKAEKAAEKAENRAEKNQIANLKSAQNAEILAYRESLSDSGLSNKEIKELLKEEKRANKTELQEARQTLGEGGLQYIGRIFTRPDGTEVRGPILSEMSTVADEYQNSISEDIKGALSYYKDYNLPTLSVSGDATIGFGLDKILKAEYSRDPETGEYTLNNQFTRTLDAAQDYVKNTFSAEELQDQGVKLKQDQNNPELYTWKFGPDSKKGYVFFRDNHDGTFTGVGANRLAVDVPGGMLADAFREVPFLPEIAALGASFIPGAQPFAGEIYAAGKGLQAGALGGDVEDILKSAGLSYLGSNVMPGVIKDFLPSDISNIPGVTQGVSKTAMGLLSGKDADDALRSGLSSGIGSYTGSQISDVTGNKSLGRIGGTLINTALSGGNLGKSLQGAILSNVAQSGLNQIAPSITETMSDPTMQRIAESSLSSIVTKGLGGGTPRPPRSNPIPGVVRRQFQPTAQNEPAPIQVYRGGKIVRRFKSGGLSSMKARKWPSL